MSLRGDMSWGAWISLKLRQRVAARLHSARVRWSERLGVARPSDLDLLLLPWDPIAAVPGDPGRLPWITPPAGGKAQQALAAAIRAHRFRLLSPVACDVTIDDPARKARIAALAEGLPQVAVADYRPIDWHCDARCGYRWPANQLYLDVPVAPSAGADIKFPRELSRFQHIGALAQDDVDAGGVEFLLQAIDWIEANPVRRGVNWACTMDVALRAVNWIWGLRLFEPVALPHPRIVRLIANSLRDHGLHIADNLEYYPDCTGNHYLANIAGLIYIGASCPAIPEADLWLSFGIQELMSEMGRQVYEDGADYEASSHYHRLVADMFTSCAAVIERLPAERRARLRRVRPEEWRHQPRLRPLADAGVDLAAAGQLLPMGFYDRLTRMAEYTATLTKPNGRVPQFGDNDSARAHFLLPGIADNFSDHAHLPATVGILLDRADLVQSGSRAVDEALLVAGDLRGRIASPPARSLDRPVVLFPRAGVAVSRAGRAWVAMTCGPNGQGGRGGHGHNDKNAFELNVGGCDFVVDGGCPVYTAAPAMRNRYRSTAVHSTVVVEGVEQDQWAPGPAGLFRLPERSSPHLEVAADGWIVGTHRGFGAVHQRRLRLEAGRLLIEDELDDNRQRVIVFNLDPAVTVEALNSDRDRVTGRFRHIGGEEIGFTIVGATSPTVDAGAFGRGYGEPVDNLRFSAQLTKPIVTSELRWAA